MTEGADDLFDHLGDGTQVTYRPKSGPPVTLTAIVAKAVDEVETATDGQERRVELVMTISRTPTSPFGGVASPALHATVEIDGVEYTVTEAVARGAMARLHLVRTTALRVTRPRFFRGRE